MSRAAAVPSRRQKRAPAAGRATAAAAPATAPLAAYRKKRDFRQSREPAGEAPAPAAKAEEVLSFVIQKHDATRLHYDLRLEMEGVLRSWAVPKGLPEEPGVKVLAVEVEDHPLEYGDFEGTIPAGNYGAGTVMVWDRGHYLAQGDAVAGHRQGHLDFALVGEKCTGSWTLIRMRGGRDAGKTNWLLIKRHDPGRAHPIQAQGRDASVKTGRTLEQIAAGKAATPRKRARPAAPAAVAKPAAPKSTKPRRRSANPPGFIEPMKAQATTAIPAGDWRLEIKFDGFRALAVLEQKRVELWSRNQKTWPDRFPEVRAALAELDCEDAILDGELVALDATGRPSFQMLQNEARGARPPLRYYVFDLLRLNGESWLDRPIEERQHAVAGLLRGAPEILQLSPVFTGPAERLLAEVQAKGLEGIVAKAAGSRYEPGRRSGTWLKCRLAQEQELVIGGYTPPQGSRPYFGALLVGYYDGRQLLYAGKVGTGFDRKRLQELHGKFAALRQPECPFANLPSARRSRYGQGMTATAMREVTWLRPELVAQIKFAEWTDDGALRQPVFLGLRDDKPAREVVREALAD